MWFVGVALHLPSIQRDLANSARTMLDDAKYDGVFQHVSIAFSGQEVTMTGAVARAEEKILLEKIMREDVRLRDEQPWCNPVTVVHNRVLVDPAAAPKRHASWILAAVYGPQKRIEGVLKSPAQRHALLEKMERFWPSPDPTNRERANQIIVDEKAWPAEDWEKTLASLPDFSALLQEKKGRARALIAVTTGNGQWQTFQPEASDLEIAAALSTAGVGVREITLALNDFRIRPETGTSQPPP